MAKENKSYVYKITNMLPEKNGKCYIGKSNNPKTRKNKHFNMAEKIDQYSYECSYIHRAIHKYGEENFNFEIIEECESSKKALEREVYYIAKYNTNKSIGGYGYNLTNGGDGGFTKEVRDKINKTLKENEIKRKINAQTIFNNYFINYTPTYTIGTLNKEMANELKIDIVNLYWNNHIINTYDLVEYFKIDRNKILYIIRKYENGFYIPDPEIARKNRSVAQRGKIYSDERKRLISEKTMGENNPNYNKTHTKESRKIISNAVSAFAKTKEQLSPEKLANISSKISKALKGKQKATRTPESTIKEIYDMFETCQYTKKQLAEHFKLKLSTVDSVLRIYKRRANRNKITK